MSAINPMARRTWLKGALALTATLPLSHPGDVLAEQPIEDYVARYVHPDLRPIARQMLASFGKDFALSAEALPMMRQGMSGGAFGRPRSADIPVEARAIPGGKGNPPVKVQIVNARPGEARPAILHMHGGGYVMGMAEMAVAELQSLCRELGCAAVSVDYRLAPETSYAGSVEDNYAALKWLHANGPSIGVDPARIALMGESAGGGHAALLAIVARDRGEVPVAFQCLIYPMLDDRTGTSRPVPAHVGRILWTPESNRFGWRSFLGMEPGGANVPKDGVPARVENLAGLPPAFIGVGALDLFLDEDIDYARRLNAVGVRAELLVLPGAFHGFDALPMVTGLGRRFNAAKIAALREGLGLKAG